MSNTRIAQIGVGHWGKNLARNYAQLGALAAVADYHAPTAERIAQEHGTEARSFEDILADDSIHGVSLATPAETHADVAIAALEAGKHVLSEKPMASKRLLLWGWILASGAVVCVRMRYFRRTGRLSTSPST